MLPMVEIGDRSPSLTRRWVQRWIWSTIGSEKVTGRKKLWRNYFLGYRTGFGFQGINFWLPGRRLPDMLSPSPHHPSRPRIRNLLEKNCKNYKNLKIWILELENWLTHATNCKNAKTRENDKFIFLFFWFSFQNFKNLKLCGNFWKNEKFVRKTGKSMDLDQSGPGFGISAMH